MTNENQKILEFYLSYIIKKGAVIEFFTAPYKKYLIFLI